MENVIHKLVSLSGMELSLTQEIKQSVGLRCYAVYNVFRLKCTVENDKQHGHLIRISSSILNLRACKELKKDFGLTVKPNQNILIKIHVSDFEKIQAVVDKANEPYNLEKEQEQMRVDSSPRRIVYYSGLEWGDYSMTSYSQIVELREPTEKEKEKSQRLFYQVRVVKNNVVQPKKLGLELEKISDWSDGEIFNLTPSQLQVLSNATDEAIAQEIAKKQEQEIRSAEIAKKRKEEQEAEKKKIEEEELFIWHAETVYSQAGNSMLHSLGANFHSEQKVIGVYVTSYAKDIPNSNIQSAKAALKNEGFTFHSNSNEYQIVWNDDNAQKVIEFLKKNSVKAWPGSLGMSRCWECGCFSKNLDRDGYCGC